MEEAKNKELFLANPKIKKNDKNDYGDVESNSIVYKNNEKFEAFLNDLQLLGSERSCDNLCSDCVLEKLNGYLEYFIKEDTRIPYNLISSKIYQENGVELPTLIIYYINLIEVCKTRVEDADHTKYNKLLSIALKISDHVNIAVLQTSEYKRRQEKAIELLSTKSDDIMKKLNSDASEFNNKISEKINESIDTSDTLRKELISIVSIFVGISFVVFGGLNLLQNLFSLQNDTIPLIELIILGLFFGIIINITIRYFMIFILFLVEKNKFDEKYERFNNITKKNNNILLILLVIAITVFFVERVFLHKDILVVILNIFS